MKIDQLLTTDELYKMATDRFSVPIPDSLEEDLYRHITDLSVRDFLLLQLVHEIRDLKYEIDALQECIAPGRD